MKKLLLAAVALAAMLPLFARHGSGEAPSRPATSALVVSGSSAMAPLVQAMARRFEQLHPGVHIEISADGSGRGLADVRAGYAQVGMVSRALRTDEQDLRGLPIARDGIALVVHADNPVPALSHAQVVAVYSGQVTSWKPLGGRDEPILTLGAPAGERSSPSVFASHFRLPLGQLQAQRTQGGNAERLQLLYEHRNAIAYVSVGEAERERRAGAPLRLLPDEGIPASSRSIGKGDYPLARPLTLVTRPQPGTLAQAFIAFCASSQVTDLVVAHDFVPYLD
jgi:phosphate transport system substrate-binding protein